MRPVVLDTNIVLDVFVFADARVAGLREALHAREALWIATAAMRDECARVLGYPQIAKRLAFYALSANDVLAHFDAHAQVVDAAPKCAYTCKDADDQGFIDLAAAHGALLLSKDAEVLCMRKRLERLGAVIASAWDATHAAEVTPA